MEYLEGETRRASPAAHDVKLLLQALRRHVVEPGAQPAAAGRSIGRILGWTIAALALVAASVLGARYVRVLSQPGPLVRASLLPPAAHSFTPNDFAISHDGRRVAFVAAGADGVATLWVKSLEASHRPRLGRGRYADTCHGDPTGHAG